MLKNSKESIGREMLHLEDTCKREAKYSRFVYTDTYAAIKQADVVDHNFSFKDALCLPQQLSLISFIKSALSVQSSTCCKACGLFIIERMADVLTAFN